MSDTPAWLNEMLDAQDAACERGEHDLENSFTTPLTCPNCGYESDPDPLESVAADGAAQPPPSDENRTGG